MWSGRRAKGCRSCTCRPCASSARCTATAKTTRWIAPRSTASGRRSADGKRCSAIASSSAPMSARPFLRRRGSYRSGPAARGRSGANSPTTNGWRRNPPRRPPPLQRSTNRRRAYFPCRAVLGIAWHECVVAPRAAQRKISRGIHELYTVVLRRVRALHRSAFTLNKLLQVFYSADLFTIPCAPSPSSFDAVRPLFNKRNRQPPPISEL
mmetsp:Transcript_31293/g.78015  ORF Transcript_31293/g.78015 Transcript_31293/m.78015 type:complete len:209 (+) Transcript_31293:1292-1918(+)